MGMTLEEAIVILEEVKVFDDSMYAYNSAYSEAIDLAIEALKAQEPIPPKKIDGKHNHFLKCGSCNSDLMSGMKYCSQCGKKVKWDD